MALLLQLLAVMLAVLSGAVLKSPGRKTILLLIMHHETPGPTDCCSCYKGDELSVEFRDEMRWIKASGSFVEEELWRPA